MKGRLGFLRNYFGPFEIREYDVPDPEPGAILIRILSGGVCGSDLHVWRGEQEPRLRLDADGRCMGHEMVGRVEKLGQGVSTDSLGLPLEEGDRITYGYFFPCNRCATCLEGLRAACPNRFHASLSPEVWPHFKGAYADYYYLKPNHYVFKVPDGLSDQTLTPVNCALSQVIYGFDKVGLRIGDTVVIQGAGGLGLNATAVAKERGADRIIVVDRHPGRLQLATAFGATHTVNFQDHETVKARVDLVKDLTRSRGADIVCDFVGYPQVIPEGLEMLKNGGTYLEIGNISPGEVNLDPSTLSLGFKQIQGIVHYDPWVIPKAISFLEKNIDKYPLDKVISHVYPLEEIDEAFEQAEWRGREGDPTKVTRACIVP